MKLSEQLKRLHLHIPELTERAERIERMIESIYGDCAKYPQLKVADYTMDQLKRLVKEALY